jgi:hypothetical protein
MLTDWILHTLATLVRWRFFLLPALIALPVLGAILTRGGCLALLALPLAIILGVGNVIFGPNLSVTLIHRYGVPGEATVTGTYATDISYNDRRVMGHKVLIRTSDGQTVESSFEDDDFNVYPPANGVYYPQDGDRFNVSHLQQYPSDFVIISDDDSPWAHGLRCRGLMSAVREADAKRRFARDSAAYANAYDDAVKAAQTAGCDTGRYNAGALP